MTDEKSIELREERNLTIGELKNHFEIIAQAMREVMVEGEDYGVIPGCKKPSLLKPGAEKLCLLFRLAPSYKIEKVFDADHLSITTTSTLTHIPTDRVFASGLGSCSTKESKYAYRESQRRCPKCGTEAIIKGKSEFGGGWLCFQKKGGCGAKFADADEAIRCQIVSRVPNPDLADQHNTVLKMSNKRALVAAILNATAASQIFTQDLEDHADDDESIGKPPLQKPERKAANSIKAGEHLVTVLGTKPKGNYNAIHFKAQDGTEHELIAFSKTVLANAEALKEKQANITIEASKDGKYLNITSIEAKA